MKFKIITLFTLLTILFSCSENKEKYYGEWTIQIPDLEVNEAERLIIAKDSVTISKYPFLYFYTQKTHINRGKIKILGAEFDIKRKDSLLEFNKSTYLEVNEYNQSSYQKQLISVDFPKIENVSKMKDIDYSSTYFIFYGKRIDSSGFGLQLNDKIAEISELKSFLLNTRRSHDYRYYVVLHADKDSRMTDIDKIFKEMKSVNFRKAYLVNNESFIVKNDTSLVTATEAIPIRLTDYYEEDNILHERIELIKPPRPPERSLHKIIKELKIQKVISLINNEFYLGLDKIEKEDLKDSIKQNFTSYFINLYDDNSTYENYLELINAYRVAFYELRDKESLKKYNKPLDSLRKEQLREIKDIVPMFVINGISYSDFKKLEIDIPELELISNEN